MFLSASMTKCVNMQNMFLGFEKLICFILLQLICFSSKLM